MPTASGRSRSTLVVALLALAVAGGTLVVYRRHGGPSRPTEPPDPGPPGTVRTTLATTTTGRRGAYYIPRDHASPRPLLVMLHGTGGTGSAMILRLRALAERERFVALAPDSESVAGVWRVEPGPGTHDQGPDHRHVLRCVREVLALVHVDRARVRPVEQLRSLAAELTRRATLPEVQTRVFHADHVLEDEELAALVAWWLRR